MTTTRRRGATRRGQQRRGARLQPLADSDRGMGMAWDARPSGHLHLVRRLLVVVVVVAEYEGQARRTWMPCHSLAMVPLVPSSAAASSRASLLSI